MARIEDQTAFGSAQPDVSIGRVRGAISDARRASSADQMVADADQSASDADQMSSDTDQTASDRDQTGAERDQRASDQDQAMADIDRAAHRDLTPDEERAYNRYRENRADARSIASETDYADKRQLASETTRRPSEIGWQRFVTRAVEAGTRIRPTWHCRRTTARRSCFGSWKSSALMPPRREPGQRKIAPEPPRIE